MFQIILGINWLAEGRFREKWERFKAEQGTLDLSAFLPGSRHRINLVETMVCTV